MLIQVRSLHLVLRIIYIRLIQTQNLATLVRNQVRKTEHKYTGFDVGTLNIGADPTITASGMYMLVDTTVGSTTAPTVKLSSTDDPKEKLR